MYGEKSGFVLLSNRDDTKMKDTVEIREKKRDMCELVMCALSRHRRWVTEDEQ